MSTPAPSTTLRRDIASAYLATGSRIASWAVVSAIVYRVGGDDQFAILALVRASLGVLTYTTLGLGPAMIHMLAGTVQTLATAASASVAAPAERPNVGVLNYSSPRDRREEIAPLTNVYVHGLVLAIACALVGIGIIIGYAATFDLWHELPQFPRLVTIREVIILIGIGIMARLFSDASGALLQVRGFIWLDNLLLAAGEALWIILMIDETPSSWAPSQTIVAAAETYCVASVLLLAARFLVATLLRGSFQVQRIKIQFAIFRRLIAFGGVVMIGQLADFLYSPIDYILINRLISPYTGAIYAPAVQIDSGLLLLVTGLGAVLFPKTALAHARGDMVQIRDYYIRGTILSAVMLFLAALVIWGIRRDLFLIWFDDPMPATQAILPLVLIHTVVGGSSAVGRSILLGMGRAKAFTLSVLLAGAGNVLLSYCLVRYFDLGLRGIVLGTIIVVVARAGIWMPWYVLRVLRQPPPAGGL